MVNTSNFRNDLTGSEIIGDILDRYFYPYILDNIEDENKQIMRITERNDQFSGIDLKMTIDNNTYLIDEKTCLDYPNGLPTFAFELQSKNRNGNYREGWFLDDSKKTTHYLLVWPIRDNVRIRDLTEDNIHKLEIMLINKNAIKRTIESNYELNENFLREKVDEILDNNYSGKINYEHDVYFYRTPSYKKIEEPINLIIKKNILRKLAKINLNIIFDETEGVIYV